MSIYTCILLWSSLDRIIGTMPVNESNPVPSSFHGETSCLIPKKNIYQSRYDRLAATVPADLIGGFHRFTLAALARCTAPMFYVS